MKLNKRTGIYQASNVTFNSATIEAYSYRWWKFVAVVEGKLVFNNYRYSNTTTKHQWKVRHLLHELAIKIDIEMPLPAGIIGNNLGALIVAAEECLCEQFLKEQLKKQDRYQRAKRRKIEKKQVETSMLTHAAHDSHSEQMRVLALIKGDA